LLCPVDSLFNRTDQKAAQEMQMTISEEQNRVETAEPMSRAMSLFTNRCAEIALFVEYLHKPQNSILFLHGERGNGKSLLLRHLQKFYCKKLNEEDWQSLAFLGDRELCLKFAKMPGTAVPAALVDFGFSAQGKLPVNALVGLLMLYLELARQGISLPTFRYAAVHYLLRSCRMSWENIEKTFPQSDEANALAGARLAPFGLKSGQTDPAVTADRLNWYRAQVSDKALLDALERCDSESELAERLPEFLARDINAYASRQSVPLLLIFDTYQAFFFGTHVSRTEQLRRDLWLRILLSQLHIGKNLQVVISGREEPVWQEAPDFAIAAERLQLRPIGGLTRQDAGDYLSRAGITDPSIVAVLLQNAEIGADQIHPLYLALCTDAVLEAKKRNLNPSAAEFSRDTAISTEGEPLSQQFLNYFDDETARALRALSACRSFDYEIAAALCKGLGITLSQQDFAGITAYSFVQEYGGMWRIHSMLRGILEGSRDQTFIKAHALLVEYYKNLSGEADGLSATIEAIYHLNNLDWKSGIAFFLSVFRGLLSGMQAAYCGLLLGVLCNLTVGTTEAYADIMRARAQYFTLVGAHPYAMAALLEARSALTDEKTADSPEIKEQLASVYLEMAETAQTLQMDAHAIEYGTACCRLCEEIFSAGKANRKMVALGLMSLVRLADYYMSMKNLDAAVELCKAALQFGTDNRDNLDPYEWSLNAGTICVRRGICCWRQDAAREAISHYTSAVKHFDEAISINENDERALTSKCNSLASMATLYSEVQDMEKAGDLYIDALTCAEETIKKVPQSASGRITHAALLVELGDCFMARELFEPAEKTYAAGLIECEDLLKNAPGFLRTYEIATRGNIGFARAQFCQKKFEEGSKSLSWAVERLELARSLPGADNNIINARKADMLVCAALCADALNDGDKMQQLLKAAVQIYQELVKVMPSNEEFKQRLEMAQNMLTTG
jgi:tetratricopeptide (TPR) repeat protein